MLKNTLCYSIHICYDNMKTIWPYSRKPALVKSFACFNWLFLGFWVVCQIIEIKMPPLGQAHVLL